MRGLDLLCGRPEVDPDRLGVTGISGGGTQSWYIGAADPRVKVVAPVCGTSTLNSHIFQRTIDGHCDCMMPINTYRRDFHDIGTLIAPRPLLIASADRDGLNSIEAVRDVYGRLKEIYKLYDKPDNVLLVETPGGHSYHERSRTRIFSFFIKHLMGKDVPPEEVGDVDESESAMLPAEELQVYVDGPPADDRTKTIQETFVKMAAPPAISNTKQLTAHRDKVLAFLREKTFRASQKILSLWISAGNSVRPTVPLMAGIHSASSQRPTTGSRSTSAGGKRPRRPARWCSCYAVPTRTAGHRKASSQA